MFPLAHNYMSERIMTAAPGPFATDFSPFERRLLLVGSILPDFVAGMGLDRNYWHYSGAEFYHYVVKNCPEKSALALGIWLHGNDGCGFDTFADEVWEGKMGWCFLKCLPYIPDAVLACNLPREFALWKAHNLVEMAAELEIAAARPHLGQQLMSAIHDEETMQTITDVFAAYANAKADNIRRVLQTMDQRFSILEVSPEDSARKYLQQLERRHNITGGSVSDLAALLEQIRSDLHDEFWQWFDEVERLLVAEYRKRF
jgi:hypothetical protein